MQPGQVQVEMWGNAATERTDRILFSFTYSLRPLVTVCLAPFISLSPLLQTCISIFLGLRRVCLQLLSIFLFSISYESI